MGVEVLSPPRDLPNWRHRTLFFRDPEGNIIEIYDIEALINIPVETSAISRAAGL